MDILRQSIFPIAFLNLIIRSKSWPYDQNRRRDLIMRFQLATVIFATIATLPVDAKDVAIETEVSEKQSNAALTDEQIAQHIDSLKFIQQAQKFVPRMAVVSPAVIRGSNPGTEGLRLLKQASVKTIVDLRYLNKQAETVKDQTRSMGFRYVNIPMKHFDPISQDQIDKFLKIVRDPLKQPVYVHCEQGKDRTSAMLALYRMKECGWTPTHAYREMLSYDFHPLFRPMLISVWSYSNKLGFNEPLPPFTDAVDDIERRYQVIMQEYNTRTPATKGADVKRLLRSVINNI